MNDDIQRERLGHDPRPLRSLGGLAVGDIVRIPVHDQWPADVHGMYLVVIGILSPLFDQDTILRWQRESPLEDLRSGMAVAVSRWPGEDAFVVDLGHSTNPVTRVGGDEDEGR